MFKRPVRRKTPLYSRERQPSVPSAPMSTSSNRTSPNPAMVSSFTHNNTSEENKTINQLIANLSTQQKTIVKYNEEFATEFATQTDLLEESLEKNSEVISLLSQMGEDVKGISHLLDKLLQLMTNLMDETSYNIKNDMEEDV